MARLTVFRRVFCTTRVLKISLKDLIYIGDQKYKRSCQQNYIIEKNMAFHKLIYKLIQKYKTI